MPRCRSVRQHATEELIPRAPGTIYRFQKVQSRRGSALPLTSRRAVGCRHCGQKRTRRVPRWGLQTAIRTEIVVHLNRRLRAPGDALSSVDQKLKAARIFNAFAQINPRAGAEKGRQARGIEWFRNAWQQDKKQTKFMILSGAVEGDIEFLTSPIANSVWTHKKGTSRCGAQTGG